jgi:hypothetical protein
VRTLGELINQPTPFPSNTQTLLKNMLSISEAILSWGFINASHILFDEAIIDNTILDKHFDNNT